MSVQRILVTGGAGYIGSHTAKLLRSRGLEPIVYDNLATGNRVSVRWGPFIHGDVLDTVHLARTITQQKPAAIIHFAASAYVGESVKEPSKYYRNNVAGTLSLLDACLQAGVDTALERRYDARLRTYASENSATPSGNEPKTQRCLKLISTLAGQLWNFVLNVNDVN